MAYRKTAIAIPADLVDEVDAAAQERGWSRSRFISDVLRRAVRSRRDAEITRRLDELFADDTSRARQRKEADRFATEAVRWDDEHW